MKDEIKTETELEVPSRWIEGTVGGWHWAVHETNPDTLQLSCPDIHWGGK